MCFVYVGIHVYAYTMQKARSDTYNLSNILHVQLNCIGIWCRYFWSISVATVAVCNTAPEIPFTNMTINSTYGYVEYQTANGTYFPDYMTRKRIPCPCDMSWEDAIDKSMMPAGNMACLCILYSPHNWIMCNIKLNSLQDVS